MPAGERRTAPKWARRTRARPDNAWRLASIARPPHQPPQVLAKGVRCNAGRFAANGSRSHSSRTPTGAEDGLEERLQPGLCAPQDQRVHVVRALVGVDGLEVRGVAHDVVLDLDAVAAVHVAGRARNVERLAAVVALDDGD